MVTILNHYPRDNYDRNTKVISLTVYTYHSAVYKHPVYTHQISNYFSDIIEPLDCHIQLLQQALVISRNFPTNIPQSIHTKMSQIIHGHIMNTIGMVFIWFALKSVLCKAVQSREYVQGSISKKQQLSAMIQSKANIYF